MSNYLHPDNNSATHTHRQEDDTPMALLEQLVYMDNFIPINTHENHNGSAHGGNNSRTNVNGTPGTLAGLNPSNDPFDTDFGDQLTAELAAFADDSFIFPDEDKPKNKPHDDDDDEEDDEDDDDFDNKNRNNNNKNSNIPSTISELLGGGGSNNNNNSRNNNNNDNNNNSGESASGHQPQHFNSGDVPQTFNQIEVVPTPQSINNSSTHSRSVSASQDNVNSHNTPNNHNNNNNNSNNNNNHNNNNNNGEIHLPKVHVPAGAQNTLFNAGLSQTQIEALATLIAYHKSESKTGASNGSQNQQTQQNGFNNQHQQQQRQFGQQAPHITQQQLLQSQQQFNQPFPQQQMLSVNQSNIQHPQQQASGVQPDVFSALQNLLLQSQQPQQRQQPQTNLQPHQQHQTMQGPQQNQQQQLGNNFNVDDSLNSGNNFNPAVSPILQQLLLVGAQNTI
ncbi:unnamed protein product [[Candida] boidinii]|nr:unnamed protein product [[Candida] boidinii]